MIDSKIKITEEENIHNEWYLQAKDQTLDSLQGFINHIINDYEHDYGTICHAMSACSIATMWAINKTDQGGITGFQAGAIMWEFIKHWNYTDNKTGMKMVNYDDMLYPQYDYKFQKTITESIWKSIQDVANNRLKENKTANPKVIAHWKSIVNGKIPFGYKIVKD